MDRQLFDALSRRVDRALGRRAVLQAPLLATVLASALAGGNPEAAGKRRRKRKTCRNGTTKCGKQCLPPGSCCVDSECGICQRCDSGACVPQSDGSACADGGVCRNQVCKPDRSLGCSVAQDSCGPAGSVLCPDRGSGVSNVFCFVDADGDPVCGEALCTDDATGASCPGLTGAGSIVLPCLAICGVAPINKTHMCVKPVA